MTLDQLNKKKWRYDTAIEALTELVEHDDEKHQKLQPLIEDFKQKRADAFECYKRSKDLHEMQVNGIDYVTGNQ